MVFSDLFFLFVFIPCFALFYVLAGVADRLLSNRKEGFSLTARNLVIVLFSLIFYAWGEPVYVFLMLFVVLGNYISGRLIDGSVSHRKAFLWMGVSFNILTLGVFKYAGFIFSSLSKLGMNLPDPSIPLPIGISFYTFQSISYLVDVYRKQSPCQKKLRDLLLYISMFPQLIAGPIVRYGTIEEEIHSRKVTAEDLSEGMFRFLVGLGKKVILANSLSGITTQFLGTGSQMPGPLSVLGAATGIVAFTLQIYFDFSGYSDMAIGLGRCMGFHFRENFDHPYCCTSTTDFWRRWHISLGSFFRDYVYIPMGGNRRHQMLNIFVVWALTGLWHGASWNFVLWGLYFGLLVWLEKFTLLRIKDRIPGVLLHIYSLVAVILGWGLFYFDNLSAMKYFFSSLFGGGEGLSDFTSLAALGDHFWLFVFSVFFCLPVGRWMGHVLRGRKSPSMSTVLLLCRIVASLLILSLSVALLVGATNNPFIYTRF